MWYPRYTRAHAVSTAAHAAAEIRRARVATERNEALNVRKRMVLVPKKNLGEWKGVCGGDGRGSEKRTGAG